MAPEGNHRNRRCILFEQQLRCQTPVCIQAMPGLSSGGLQLGDWVMVRQQAYLDSLRIDVTPINQAISSFIRRLLPGGGR